MEIRSGLFKGIEGDQMVNPTTSYAELSAVHLGVRKFETIEPNTKEGVAFQKKHPEFKVTTAEQFLYHVLEWRIQYNSDGSIVSGEKPFVIHKKSVASFEKFKDGYLNRRNTIVKIEGKDTGRIQILHDGGKATALQEKKEAEELLKNQEIEAARKELEAAKANKK